MCGSFPISHIYTHMENDEEMLGYHQMDTETHHSSVSKTGMIREVPRILRVHTSPNGLHPSRPPFSNQESAPIGESFYCARRFTDHSTAAIAPLIRVDFDASVKERTLLFHVPRPRTGPRTSPLQTTWSRPSRLTKWTGCKINAIELNALLKSIKKKRTRRNAATCAAVESKAELLY